jgi:ribosomal protein L35AE/L33A
MGVRLNEPPNLIHCGDVSDDLTMTKKIRRRSVERGKHISFTHGKRNTTPSTSLIKIEGCDSIKDAEFYLGKRTPYVYKVCFP